MFLGNLICICRRLLRKLVYVVRPNIFGANAYATGNVPYSEAFDPSGKYLYVTNEGNNTVTVFSVSSGGGLTQLSTLTVPSGGGPAWIATAPVGN